MTAFYTYVHIRNDSTSIFYVGKGKDNRAHSKVGRSEHWKRISAKHGHTVQIIEHFESESDSFAHERYLISSLRDCGILLCNMTDGGDGASNPCIESRAKMSLAATGNTRAKGFKHTDESRLKMGGARKGTGGAMPGAGRKPDPVPTMAVEFRLTQPQRDIAKALGGSPWLQGLLNLEIRRAAGEFPFAPESS